MNERINPSSFHIRVQIQVTIPIKARAWITSFEATMQNIVKRRIYFCLGNIRVILQIPGFIKEGRGSNQGNVSSGIPVFNTFYELPERFVIYTAEKICLMIVRGMREIVHSLEDNLFALVCGLYFFL